MQVIETKLRPTTIFLLSFLILFSIPSRVEGCEEYELDYVIKKSLIMEVRGSALEEAGDDFIVLAKRCGFYMRVEDNQKEERRQPYGKVSIEKERTSLDDLIIKTANRYGIDPALLKALVHAESNFDKYALSPKGARGLTQVMPQTARALGINPDQLWNPSVSLDTGTRYLVSSLDKHGSLKKSLVAYSSGPSVAARVSTSKDLRRIPKETRLYLKRVLKLYEMYRASGFGR